MAYFRKLDPQHALPRLLDILTREDRWLIMINADPDALASAMALRRILIHRVHDVGIAHVNEITRPDNLAMIRLLRIPTRRFTPNVVAQFDRFALVDSQPHHHPSFDDVDFSLVIDHHPLSKDNPVRATLREIKPDYGSVSTLFTEYLYNLGIRPGKLLATALLYGIKTDTHSFERPFCDVDMRAFRYLSKFADHLLLRKIVRSEFKMHWLRYFGQAFGAIRPLRRGFFIYMGEVENPDVLVILADFFMRVHEISWAVVAGVARETLVSIFRGDGLRRGMPDVGGLAATMFGDVGSAGGHASMARAEIPLSRLKGQDPEAFLWKRFSTNPRTMPAKGASIEL